MKNDAWVVSSNGLRFSLFRSTRLANGATRRAFYTTYIRLAAPTVNERAQTREQDSSSAGKAVNEHFVEEGSGSPIDPTSEL